MTYSSPRPWECSEVIAVLYPYLDRELTDDEQRQVQDHLAQCGNCAQLFRFEAAMLSLVGNHLREIQAPADLRSRIAQLTRATP
jgi:anti-sigma factor (TIGR02949 family)